MKATHHRIVVRVNMDQKNFIKMAGVEILMANKFDPNYRERSPVVAEIIEGNNHVRKGQIAVFHHNHFYEPSPYFLKDDLFSVPFNATLFGILDGGGDIVPMCGTILCQCVEIDKGVAPTKEFYKDRVIVTEPGWTIYKKGDLLFTKKSAPYEIVYTWNGIQKRIFKIHEEHVIGIEPNNKQLN